MDAAATAQDAYRRMLREYIAPALRALGFRREPSPGAFRHETAAHACEVRFRKSRGSTRRGRLPSIEPMQTTPWATAGEEKIWLVVAPVHSGTQASGVPEQPVVPAALR